MKAFPYLNKDYATHGSASCFVLRFHFLCVYLLLTSADISAHKHVLISILKLFSLKTPFHTKICMRIFIVALYIITKTWEQ